MIAKRTVTLGSIGLAFLRLGAGAFGGLGAAISLLERDLVQRRKWLTVTDVRDALAFTKPLPGSTVVQVVAFLGWRLCGWPGALLAVVAFIAPATVLMIAAAAGAAMLPDRPWVHGAIIGVSVAVVGLLASAMWRLARSEAPSARLSVVLVIALVAGFFVNAAVVVATAGLVGLSLEWWRSRGA